MARLSAILPPLVSAAVSAGAVALAVQLATAGILARLPAELGEPLPLRWLRAAADHPVRTPAALTCLLLAVRRRRPAERRKETGREEAADPTMRYHGAPSSPKTGHWFPREPAARDPAPRIHDDRHPS